MSMRAAIENFNHQFEFEPVVENAEGFHPGRYKKFIVSGMGGSQLAAELLKTFRPETEIINWRDYDLPRAGGSEETLVIASSYSGNTEETVSAFHEAKKRSMPVAAIARGGELLELAKRHNAPLIKLPDDNIQPRSALGYSFRAFLKIMGDEELLASSRELSRTLRPGHYEGQGEQLAHAFKGFIPVIYASRENAPVAYIWKIQFNETGKIPAFYNVFPELNHNEMNGFGASGAARPLSQMFSFIFLKSHNDDARVQKRMDVTREIYEKMKMPVREIEIRGDDRLHAVFSSIILGNWAAYHAAELYGHDSENVPVVEELKKLMK